MMIYASIIKNMEAPYNECYTNWLKKKKLEYVFCLICSGCDGTAHHGKEEII
jgi:hypothetical protein